MATITQKGRPETCDCWVRFTASTDENGDPSVEPLEIISTCEEHEGITDVATLHATHLAEMAPKAEAQAIIRDAFQNLISWSIEPGTREILMLVDDSQLDEIERAAFRALLEAVSGIDVSYRHVG